MHFNLEPSSGIPLGVQIGRQLRLAITSGRLAPGERLPSARDLAAELKVNFHTVRKAYGDLEQAGLVRQERGLGTFVADRAPRPDEEELRALVRGHVERLLADLAGLGLRADDIVRLVERELSAGLRQQKG
jgi:GntR family transcriptional regulator